MVLHDLSFFISIDFDGHSMTPAVDLDYLPKLPLQKEVPIGCIGSGFIMADCHLVAYRNNGLSPVAITSRTPARAQAVAARHGLQAFDTVEEMLASGAVEVVDIAVPPDNQRDVIAKVVQHRGRIRGILAQKPLGTSLAEAREIVAMCEDAGIMLVVNQNMRYDQAVRAAKSLLRQNLLGEPVLATLDMRAIPHWMPWQERQGWVTLRIMSIHHLDTFRFWFGDPQNVFASVRPDPRTSQKFAHQDGICLYVLEYASGLRVMACDDVWAGPALEGAAKDIGINWRIEGTKGLAKGTVGWPDYPKPTPSTLKYSTCSASGEGTWTSPTWQEVWFPDAFVGPMAELLCALESNSIANLNGHDNLFTMALVDACYLSAKEHRVVALEEVLSAPSPPNRR